MCIAMQNYLIMSDLLFFYENTFAVLKSMLFKGTKISLLQALNLKNEENNSSGV